MRHDLELTSHGVRIGAWHYPAQSEAWTTERGRPVIVMAHGFGATRDSGLEPFALRFAQAGADVVVFDYRGFGTSDGVPRQHVHHARHRDDYRAVVDQVRAMPGIDPERVVLWGSSYSGGHVIAVAAGDPRIAGVISQGAAMDGLAAVLQILGYAGPGQLLKLTGHALVGLVKRDHRLAVVGPPGSLSAITSDDALDGYGAITGPTFANEMLARGILPIMWNRPVASARKVTAPVFLLVAEQDSIAPPAAVRKVAERVAGPVTVETMPVGHFDIYVGEPFERSVQAQLAFLDSVLAR